MLSAFHKRGIRVRGGMEATGFPTGSSDCWQNCRRSEALLGKARLNRNAQARATTVVREIMRRINLFGERQGGWWDKLE